MPLDLPMKLPRVAAEQHEPECVGYKYLNRLPKDCTVCQIIKQAYQRGLDTAIAAVKALEQKAAQ